MDASDIRRGVMRWGVKTAAGALIFGLILFLSSGDLGWGMAWLYLGLYVLNQVILALLVPAELLAERSERQEGTKSWDVLLAALGALLLPLATYLVAGLDRRFGWTVDLSSALQGAALALMVLGMALTTWAMGVNRFFSGTVRIQDERGHAVIRAGPYSVMRHPGYAGAIAHHLAAPLVLGSLWAVVPGAAGALVLVVRTAMEDHTLQEELSGYADYARHTRYRLLPGVW
jgi:protein-S-isoprenylcysteine O-methyltransferase Ste14